jgi:hypothetical protein
MFVMMKALASIFTCVSFLAPRVSLAADTYSFAQILKKLATPTGIRWSAWNEQDKKLLTDYLDKVSTAKPDTFPSKSDQMAFWVNAHNACVMKLISEHMPVDDVMAIAGFRDQLKCNIAGTPRSLVEIESGAIRPTFQDPRIHFVLWWGCKGGPRLKTTPYEGKSIQADLEERAQVFIADSRYVKFETQPYPAFRISPIFDWYKSDFGKKDGDVLDFIRQRRSKDEGSKIPKKLNDVSFTTFDWKLDRVP